MSKLFKRFSGITLGLALCFGFSFSCNNKSSGQMTRATAVEGEGTGSLTFASGHKVTASGNTINDSANATYTFNTDSDYIALDGGAIHTGSGSKTCSYQSWNTSDYSDVLISSVVINAKMASGSGVSVSAKIDGNDLDDPKAISADAENYTFTNSKAYTGALEIKAYRSSATKKAIYIYSITVNYEAIGSGDVSKLDTPSPVFDKTNKEISWEDIDNASSYTVIVDDGTPVENATSPYSVASLSEYVKHTVKVIAVGDGTNYTNSSGGSVTFALLEHAGTADDPYTVEDARAAIDAGDGITDIYATGIVSGIVEAYSSQYGNISYNISSDGLTTSPQLEVFRGKGVGGADFTSSDDVQVGDIVVVKGNLTKHDSTYEFAANNQLVSLTRPEAPALQYLEMSGVPVSEYKTTDTSWDPTGLKIDAYYDNNTSKDVTSLVTWSYDQAAPNQLEAGDYCVSFIASYGGESVSDDFNVTVSAIQIQDDYHLSGTHIIYEEHLDDGNKYYMNVDNASGSIKPTAVTTPAQASTFLFTLVADNTYTITDEAGTKGLYHTGNASNNTLCWGDSGLTYQWKVNDTAAGTLNGTYNLIGQTSESIQRYMCVYNKSDWRTYSSATASNRKAMIQLSAPKVVDGFSVYSEGANKSVLKGTNFDAAAASAAGFQARLNYTDGTYDDVTSSASWELNTATEGPATLTVKYAGYTDVKFTDMIIYVASITSLSLNTDAVKTAYIAGDKLNLSGLTIKGYDDSNTEYDIDLSNPKCSFSPTDGTILSTSNTTVTITYKNDDNSEASASYSITVEEFVGYTKVTSANELVVGDSYVIGVENVNKCNELMGKISSSHRSRVDGTAAFNDDKTGVDKNKLPNDVAIVTLLSDGNGKYALYDIGADKYIAGDSSSNLNNKDSLSAAGDNAWWTISFENGLMSMTLNGSTRVLAYNVGSPRFATYASYDANSTTATAGMAHPVLFKMSGSDVKDYVDLFTGASLLMGDPDYEGDIETPNCSTNYGKMKSDYAEMTDAQKNVFQYSEDYAAARARLNNWATANGETFTYGNASPFESLRKTGVTGDILSPEDDSSLIILFIICTLGAGALSAFYLMKKKKRA